MADLPPLSPDQRVWRPWLRALRGAGRRPLVRTLLPLVRPRLAALADPGSFVTNQAERFLSPAQAHARALEAVAAIERWLEGSALDEALLDEIDRGLSGGRGGEAKQAATALRLLFEVVRSDAFANAALELALGAIASGVPGVEAALAACTRE